MGQCLHVDSQATLCCNAGGSALASEAIWHQVDRMRRAGKPIVVSMATYAASGGYYIAGLAFAV